MYTPWSLKVNEFFKEWACVCIFLCWLKSIKISIVEKYNIIEIEEMFKETMLQTI